MAENLKYDALGYYAVLGITPTAPEDEIRQKYRELAKFWHPDHNESPQAIDMFQKISVAYDILKEASSRTKYNLLSLIYSKNDFPDMNALCLLRNMHGQEDINLRAFHLVEITGKGIGHTKIDKIYYCSQYEAAGVIGQITRHNWTRGFLGLTGVFASIGAIVKNISSFYSQKENLQLFIHNSLVYAKEGKKAEARSLAVLAKEYADPYERGYIDDYLALLGSASLINVKKWNISKLRRIQFVYPCFLFFVVFIAAGLTFFKYKENENLYKTDLKQEVLFNNGQKTFSDVSVAKIFDIPVDVYDTKRLYHVKEKTQAMYGADEEFDVFQTVEPGTTVRLTGYTADKQWFRVMFDDGEMGFIQQNKLEQGIGNEIPLWSKIYKEK